MIRLWSRRAAVGAAGAVGVAYASSPGFRRSITFWATVSPFVAEYQWIRARAKWEGTCEAEELVAFHQRTAAKATDIILKLGGIYIKIGQFASTMGAGILEDAYIKALRPLQDGVPPRSLAQVSAIIEESVGLRMDELFETFDERPLGAASIAQAHRATLLDGAEVVVKVQYPEVAGAHEHTASPAVQLLPITSRRLLTIGSPITSR
jgi:aarF domain-containing kinase